MRVAVVGASGVLGRALVPQLINRHNVRVLVRNAQAAQKRFGGQVEVHECDLLAPGIDDKLPRMLVGCDAVIHAATAIPKDFNAPGAWDANNRLRIEGTAHLLAATVEVGATVYLQQSIALAYPDCGDEWITEATPFDKNGRNSITILHMEGQVQAIPPSQLRWSILRGGTFVGKDTFQADLIARLRAGTERVGCDGRSFMTLIHVEDVASAFAAAVERAPAGSTYNIVDEPIRQSDYLDRLAEAVGAPKPPRDPNAPCPPSWRVSNQPARDALSWQPTHAIIPNREGVYER